VICRIWHGYVTLEAAVVPPAARAVLSHFDEVSEHYEVREVREQRSDRASGTPA
jgi:hypothetical protein